MKLNEIKLCMNNAYLIDNEKFKLDLYKKIKREYNIIIDYIKPQNKYYKIFTKDDLSNLKKKRYLCSYNYNLPISYFYTVVIDDYKYNLFLIDNKIYHTYTFINIKEDLLLEGRIKDENFIINDIFVNNITFNTFIDKLKYINNIIQYYYIFDLLKDNFKLVIDIFIDYKYLKSILNDIYLLKDKSHISGLIFRDIIPNINKKYDTDLQFYYNYVYIFNKIKDEFIIDNVQYQQIQQLYQQHNKQVQHIIKINKPNKIDLVLDSEVILKLVKTKSEDIYEIYYKNQYIDFADVQDLKTSLFLKKIFKDNKYPFLFFLCKYNNKTKKWRPIKLNLLKN